MPSISRTFSMIDTVTSNNALQIKRERNSRSDFAKRFSRIALLPSNYIPAKRFAVYLKNRAALRMSNEAACNPWLKFSSTIWAKLMVEYAALIWSEEEEPS
jgi:hypothetical protein